MAEPPENGARMIVFLTKVDFNIVKILNPILKNTYL